MKTLHDLFFTELADIYDAGRRIANVPPKMAEAPSPLWRVPGATTMP